VPLIARPGTPTPEFIGILLAELAAPLADGFVGHDDPTGEQQLFDIAVAQAEAEIEPHRMADDLARKSMMFVGMRWDGGVHGSSQGGLWV
jgi:hypothetical protein